MQEKILADLTLAEKLRVQLSEHRLSAELVNNMQDPLGAHTHTKGEGESKLGVC